MTHIFRPALRRSITAMSFATAMALGAVAPSVAQAAPAATATSTSATSSVTASAGQAAADRALSRVGARYQWGATGSGAYDCSGLTSTSWAAAGVTIPRTSRAQSNATRSISRSQLQPGDLVFFSSPVSHVEMYVGNGTLVGASRSKGRVATSQLKWRSNIVGYGRP